ncbi:uncharacterized protein LOC124896656 [Capsicum annuum]|uniref:uncharacterized protein LOC124896656 n=1 Tax=Capsicum annuum TaxID=4072 RepID=UPI001FB1A198|nr:uncharacterized protein LOC124896656 [Capsicum annuum]
MDKLSNLWINILLFEAILEISGYSKLMKKLMSKKKIVEGDTIEVTHECSSIMDSKVAEKKDDPRAFTIPCTIGTHEFSKSLCDLGANINLMSFVIYKKLGIATLTPTSMQILMEDQSIKRLVGILFDVLVKVDKFMWVYSTGKAIVDLDLGEMKFRVQKNKVSFKICKSKKQTVELQVVSVVDVENEKMNEEEFKDSP